MINYYCPGIEQSLEVYKVLNFFKNRYPEIFYENTNIKYVFGTFSNMIWNGGCINMGEGKSLLDIQHICNEYDKLNINLQLTLTNPLLKEEHCHDIYCNSVLDLLKDRNYTILVASPILEDYLRSKFKNNYNFSRSIINTREDYNFEEVLNNNIYKEIVLPRRHSKNFDFLKLIDYKNRNRIEILCNDPCPIDCPRMYTHYEEYAKATLYQELYPLTKCTNNKRNNGILENYWEDNILYEDIVTQYLPEGYTEFKISGRGGEDIDILCNLIFYLVKPKYQIPLIRRVLKLLGVKSRVIDF